MSIPAPARVVKISDINNELIGQKLRVYGVLSASVDVTSTAALLFTPRSSSAGASPAVYVDLSLCIDPMNPLKFLQETKNVVMIIGTLEENNVSLSPIVASLPDRCTE